MKYILTILTSIIWYLITFYGIYFSVFLVFWAASLNSIYFSLIYPILIIIFLIVIIYLPRIFTRYLLKFYNYKWFAIISHSLFGFLGFIAISLHFATLIIQNNYELLSLIKEKFIESPINFIIILVFLITIITSITYITILSFLIKKIKGEFNYDEKEENKLKNRWQQ